MNLNTVTAALFLATGLALSAAPAGAAPGPDDISADSPTSMTPVTVGRATLKDADGIKFITHVKDSWHKTTEYPAKACTTEWTVDQHYPVIGQQFVVTDCKGFKKTFNFPGHS